ALDVARVLTADPATLATTDIADLPLATLRGSRVEEVVVLGRRGPAEAAFTLPELVGLAGLTEVDVVVDDAGAGFDLSTAKGRMLAEIASRATTPGRRRIVLRFCAAPVRILGTESVSGIELERTRLEVVDGRTVAVGTGESEILETQMVLRSVGYRGVPIPGLPFDDVTSTVPNAAGRVEPGLYVAGWIKRGPTGFIGTNKSCSEETVAALFDDLAAGLLTEPDADADALELWLAERVPAQIGLAGWQALDAEERRRGAEQGRPRVKLLDLEEMRTVASAGRPRARGRRSLPFTL
ncbi:MAG: 4Fe-4S ferredoxin, partial [Marmoricola sp.]